MALILSRIIFSLSEARLAQYTIFLAHVAVCYLLQDDLTLPTAHAVQVCSFVSTLLQMPQCSLQVLLMYSLALFLVLLSVLPFQYEWSRLGDLCCNRHKVSLEPPNTLLWVSLDTSPQITKAISLVIYVTLNKVSDSNCLPKLICRLTQ
jgi:hypothetical protein